MLEVKRAFQSTLIDKPALLIYGEQDPVHRLGIPERILTTLYKAELHLINNEGHFPHEGNGEKMGIIINEWVKRNHL